MTATYKLQILSSSPYNCCRLALSRFVPPGTKVSSKSIFTDPVWYMDDLVTTPGVSNDSKYWDFRTVPGFPAGFALTLAEYCYSRLYKPVATHDRQGEWLSIYNELGILNGFALFCSSHGRAGFNEVDKQLCEQYLQVIFYSNNEVERKSRRRARAIIFYIYRLWEYSTVLSKPIPSIPFGMPLKKLFKPGTARNSGSENKTPVIPELVFEPLLTPALDYVLNYGSTIIEVWRDMQVAWDTEIAPLSMTIGNKFKRLRKAFKRIIAGKEMPWLIHGCGSYGDLYKELHQLRTSCTITILAFSGIRPSELLSLESGCCFDDEGNDGQTMHYINTILHKHRGKGTRDTWVVIDEVVKSIEILETLTERVRSATSDNRLMISDSSNSFFPVQKDFTGAKVTEFTYDSVTQQIITFIKYCNSNLSHPPIPDWPDETGQLKPWKFNARQFRRTLARYIARQPFGVIAGMLQYKHVEVTIFEGYAGCEPEWNKMLAEERVLASIDILEELAMDLSNGAVAGEFGVRLKEDFMAEFRGRAEDFPPSQIAKWLANSKKALFVGKFNFCFFDPTKALCTIETAQKDRPILNFCQPGHCGNACVAKRHAPVWESQMKQAEEFAEHPKASAFQRHILREEVAQLQAVVVNFRS